MNFLAICCIFRDEARYLKDWLDFHKSIGVDKFILYNDHSIDNFYEVLLPYIKCGDVILINMPAKSLDQNRQLWAFGHYLKHYDKYSIWTAYIDIDEFLYSHQFSMIDILQKRQDQKAIGVNWKCYFSRDLLSSIIPVWQRSVHRPSLDFSWNKHVKLIAQSQSIQGFINPHAAALRDKQPIFNSQNKIIKQNKESIYGALVDIELSDYHPEIIINHYHINSKEEFIIKMTNGWKQMKDPSLIEASFDLLTGASNILDTELCEMVASEQTEPKKENLSSCK